MSSKFNNLFVLGITQAGDIDTELMKELARKTSEDDTNTSPVDRFRYISHLGDGRHHYDPTSVTTLFTNWENLTEEMTKKIEQSLANR